MENILQGIPQVVVQIDDTLISESDDSSHLRNLETVLGRLAAAGLRTRQDKCTFIAPEVVYLGY